MKGQKVDRYIMYLQVTEGTEFAFFLIRAKYKTLTTG